jgi:MFS transporter, ACDE family, multidrug resistance protein
MWRQPKAVWAVAFASVVAFMGIGLVDPILKPIADNLNASPSQVSLLFTSYMAVMGVAMLITGVMAGLFIGINNTLITETVMKAAPVERGVASAAYSFVRFSGAAMAPWLAGVLGEQISVHLPFWVGAAAVLLAAGVLAITCSDLAGIDVEESELDELTERASAITVGSD